MKQKSSRVTLKDVARSAGVSLSTVSRVIRNSGPISPETRADVMLAVAAVGYRPREIEQAGNSTGRYPLVALVISDILNPFFSELVYGVQEEAVPGYGLLLYNTAEDPSQELKFIEQMRALNVSGVVFCSSRVPSQSLIKFYENTGIPIVLINRRVEDPRIPAVLIDFQHAAYQATQHLINLKHSRIAYLGGLPSSETSYLRYKGILAALIDAGLTMGPELCNTSFPSVESGFQGMSSLLSLGSKKRPTAVIAYNDLIAIGALNAIRAQNLRVPEDISVVGFDGISLTAFTNPPLTTIDIPKRRMGRLAMKMLHMIISGQTTPGGYVLMESPLIIRGSTTVAPE